MIALFWCFNQYLVFIFILISSSFSTTSCAKNGASISASLSTPKSEPHVNININNPNSNHLTGNVNHPNNGDESFCEDYDYCSDISGFEAIKRIHQRLDDDADGDVDITESDDFLRDELQYENAGERHRNFHGNDKHISVDELWRQWLVSEVHNWTVDETCEWLASSLELPEYINIFQQNQINGASLPRMTNPAYISSLGIKDLKHRQKISLKAMDVVLFGPPQRHNYYKDIILLLMCVVTIGGLWFALVQYKYSQTHLKKMLKDMDSLQKAEQQLSDLQKELDEARHVQEIVSNEKMTLEERLKTELNKLSASGYQDGSASIDGLLSLNEGDPKRINELEEELQKTREQLNRAESALTNKLWVPPHQLQLLLQYTYELELQHDNSKRLAAEETLVAAKEVCEKIKKKRSSFLGSFRVAHGSSIDDVDDQILQAKSALTEIMANMKERRSRWQQIEQHCGFKVLQNPGFVVLHSELYPPYPTNSISPNDPLSLTRNNSETFYDSEKQETPNDFHFHDCDSYDMQKNTNLNRSALIYRPPRAQRQEAASTMSLPTNSRSHANNGAGTNEVLESNSDDSNDDDRPLSLMADSEKGTNCSNGISSRFTPITSLRSNNSNPCTSNNDQANQTSLNKRVTSKLVKQYSEDSASSTFPSHISSLHRSGSVPLKRDNSRDAIISNLKDEVTSNPNNSGGSSSDQSNSTSKTSTGSTSTKKKDSRKLSHVFSLRKRKSIPETNSAYFKIIE